MIDYTINVCLLGNSGVGKSSLVMQLLNNYPLNYNSITTTIGVDYFTKIFKVNKKVIKWNIYDTAGMEKFNSIVSTYFRIGTIFLLGFDLTNLESFIELEKWIKLINSNSQNYYKIYLFGNKCDLKKNIKISNEHIDDFCSKYNLKYFNISIKKRNNIDEMVEFINNDIANYILDKDISYEIKKNKKVKFHDYNTNSNFRLFNLNLNNNGKCC